MDIINTYNFYLNSKNRDTGNPENSNYFLSRVISLIDSQKTHFQICIKSVEIPYSFNQINNNNNTIQYTANYITPGHTHSIISSFKIDNGNYNINTFLTDMTIQLVIDLNLQLTTTFLNNQFSFIYNPSTCKTYFTTIISGLTIEILLSYNLFISKMLGFTTSIIIQNNINSISQNKIEIAPITNLYIRSENMVVGKNNFESIITKNISSDIITKIPVRTLPNSYIYLVDGNTENFISNTELSIINLYLTDNQNENYLFNLEGLNWSCHLEIKECIRGDYSLLHNNNITDPNKILLDKRDKILEELINYKNKLENE